MDNAYDYEYDPNLKLTTPETGNTMDLKQGSEMKDDLSNKNPSMSPGEETMPMTEEERAYLEEHYRYIPKSPIILCRLP